jgi:hypothetical protein
VAYDSNRNSTGRLDVSGSADGCENVTKFHVESEVEEVMDDEWMNCQKRSWNADVEE